GQLGQLGGQFGGQLGFQGGGQLGGQLGGLQGGFGVQGGVWNGVTQTQRKLSAALKRSVQARASASSLQLTLEHQAVREGVLGYTRKLEALPDSQTDVIGYAFAVNGEINSADVYASAALFRQLWPRLLASAAAEALAEREAETAVGPVRVSALRR